MDKQGKNIVQRRLKAIGMTFILVSLFLFLLLVPVFGDNIFSILTSNIDDKKAVDIVYNIYKLILQRFFCLNHFLNPSLMHYYCCL